MNDAAWPLVIYVIGLIAFALVGALEMALCSVELRRLDRDDWSRGEPWQREHIHAARDRERATSQRSASLIIYAPLWPLMVAAVLVRMTTRYIKGRRSA